MIRSLQIFMLRVKRESRDSDKLCGVSTSALGFRTGLSRNYVSRNTNEPIIDEIFHRQQNKTISDGCMSKSNNYLLAKPSRRHFRTGSVNRRK